MRLTRAMRALVALELQSEGLVVQEGELESRNHLVRAVGAPEDGLEEPRVIGFHRRMQPVGDAVTGTGPDSALRGGLDLAGSEDLGEGPFVKTLGQVLAVNVDVVDNHLELGRFIELEREVG